jgi:hypothetical protein
MDDGHSDPDARNLTYSLFKQIADVEPASENLKAVYPLLLEQGMQMREQPRMRTAPRCIAYPPSNGLCSA